MASGLRLGWGIGSGQPAAPENGPDELEELAAATDSALAREQRRTRPLEPGERVDLNSADSLELQRLPRVGPAMARAIVEVRSARGGFRTWDDFDAVPGVGPATLERLRPSVEPLHDAPPGRENPRQALSGRPGPKGALAINSADSASLIALPGIGPALAGRIVAYRARHGFFGTIDDLTKVKGIGPAKLDRLRPYLRAGGR